MKFIDVAAPYASLLAVTIAGVVICINSFAISGQAKWMRSLKEYSDEKLADRVTHTATQQAIYQLCDELKIDRIEVQPYKPSIKFPFPEPPKK